MITVGHKWTSGSEYIGRGSPLGNPFVMKDKSEAERNRVCDEYIPWLDDQLQHNQVVINEMNRLFQMALNVNVTLGCFCSPKRCHGDTVKEKLEQMLAARKDVS